MKTIKLGVKAKDKVTGFTGIVIAKSQWLTGCDTYGLKPKSVKNQIEDAQWFDEGQIEIIGKGVPIKEIKSKKNGGPRLDSPTA